MYSLKGQLCEDSGGTTAACGDIPGPVERGPGPTDTASGKVIVIL